MVANHKKQGKSVLHDIGDWVMVKLGRMDRDKTDASRVFSIIVDTPFEGQAKYKVRTENGIVKGILDALLVQTLPYLSAAMRNRVLGARLQLR